jgi:hypothetical protein
MRGLSRRGGEGEKGPGRERPRRLEVRFSFPFSKPFENKFNFVLNIEE